MTQIIGLIGKAGSGKSTVAEYLKTQKGYKVEKFAGPLKDMLRALGLSEAEIEGDLKEVPSDKLMGRTPRQAMQWLGTEWGRNMIGENLWVSTWVRRATSHRLCVVDDVRFPNEVLAAKDNGAVIIRIVRPNQHVIGTAAAAAHASETLMDKLDADHVIFNAGSLRDLYSSIEGVLAHVQAGAR